MAKTRRLKVSELDEDERVRITRRAKRLGLTPTQVLEQERVEARIYNDGVVSCRLTPEKKAAYVARATELGIPVAEVVRRTLNRGPLDADSE